MFSRIWTVDSICWQIKERSLKWLPSTDHHFACLHLPQAFFALPWTRWLSLSLCLSLSGLQAFVCPRSLRMTSSNLAEMAKRKSSAVLLGGAAMVCSRSLIRSRMTRLRSNVDDKNSSSESVESDKIYAALRIIFCHRRSVAGASPPTPCRCAARRSQLQMSSL